MPIIGGKQVTFKAYLPARENWDIVQTVRGMAGVELGYDDSVKVCARMIESWEFEGAPSDPAAYPALDLGDLLNLVGEAVQHLNAKLTSSKNSPRPPTSG
jgi:hypothetical protein